MMPSTSGPGGPPVSRGPRARGPRGAQRLRPPIPLAPFLFPGCDAPILIPRPDRRTVVWVARRPNLGVWVRFVSGGPLRLLVGAFMHYAGGFDAPRGFSLPTAPGADPMYVVQARRRSP